MPTRAGRFPGKERKKREKCVHASAWRANVSVTPHCGICIFLTSGVETVPKVTAASLQAGWVSRDHMLIGHWSAPSPATRVFPLLPASLRLFRQHGRRSPPTDSPTAGKRFSLRHDGISTRYRNTMNTMSKVVFAHQRLAGCNLHICMSLKTAAR